MYTCTRATESVRTCAARTPLPRILAVAEAGRGAAAACLLTEQDDSVGEVILRKTDSDSITDDTADLELLHFSGEFRSDGLAVRESYNVIAAPWGCSNYAFDFC